MSQQIPIEPELLRRFFPAVFEASCIAIDKCQGRLYEEELESIQRAVPKRKKEFLAGREIARSVLVRLGYLPCSIPVGKNREPLWPAGAVGSISHDGNLCIAVAAHNADVASVGIDLTMRTPLEGELVEMICTVGEIDAVKKLTHRPAFDPYKLVFSIKESVYKCLYPMVQDFFDFQSVSVSLDLDSETARVVLLDRALFSEQLRALRIEAKYCSIDDYLFSAVWVERNDWDSAA